MSINTAALLQWLFKTRMSFYNDDLLVLPWWFGLCCWNFAIAGVFMLWTEPQWIHQPITTCTVVVPGMSTAAIPIIFPYKIMAYLLICVQAPLSFLADYCYMTQDSYWHVVDRLLAVPLMMLELLKYILLVRHAWYHGQVQSNPHAMPLPLVVLYGMAMILAMYSFVQSTQAQTTLDHDGFVHWHTMWHLFPLLAATITGLDFYACQGWKRSTRQYMYHIEIQYLMVHHPPSSSSSDRYPQKKTKVE